MTGARPCELLALTLDSFGEGRSYVTLSGAKQKGRPRSYPVPDAVRAALSKYLRNVASKGRTGELARHLFVSVQRVGWAFSLNGLNKLYRRLRARHGIGLTAYDFRRLAATEIFGRTRNLGETARFLGHTRTSTTFRYVCDDPAANWTGVRIMRDFIPAGRA